jgi:hypothetical protein
MEIAAYVRVACAQVDLIGLLAQQSQPAAPASLGAWACSACTYENPSAKLGVCDVCGAERRADCDGGGGGGGGAGSVDVRGAIVSALEASDVWAHLLNAFEVHVPSCPFRTYRDNDSSTYRDNAVVHCCRRVVHALSQCMLAARLVPAPM